MNETQKRRSSPPAAALNAVCESGEVAAGGEESRRRRRRRTAFPGYEVERQVSEAAEEPPPQTADLSAAACKGRVSGQSERSGAVKDAPEEEATASVCAECVSAVRCRKRRLLQEAATAPQSVHATTVYRQPGCSACRGRQFQPPKPVRRPARSFRELQCMLSSKPVAVEWLRPEFRNQSLDGSITPLVRRSGPGGVEGRACWDSAEAVRCTFKSPYDSALLPRGARGLPVVGRLCERGAVSSDLGVVEVDSLPQEPAASSRPAAEAPCRCLGRSLFYGKPRGVSDASTRAALRRWLQGRPECRRFHASDDSSASSGSDVAPEDLRPEVFFPLQLKRPSPAQREAEAFCLEMLRRPLRGVEVCDVFASALSAGAPPLAALSELWRVGQESGEAASSPAACPSDADAEAVGSSVSSLWQRVEPFSQRALFERICHHAAERKSAAPSLASQLSRLFPPERLAGASTRFASFSLVETIEGLVKRRLRLGAGERCDGAEEMDSSKRDSAAIVNDPRFFRKAKAAFGSGGETALDDGGAAAAECGDVALAFASLEDRLSHLAMGIEPFDPDEQWTALARRRQNEGASPQPGLRETTSAECPAKTSSDSPTAVSPEISRVQLSKKYRHPNVVLASDSDKGAPNSWEKNKDGEEAIADDQDGIEWQRAELLGNRCGVVLGTHAARGDGLFFFEAQLEAPLTLVEEANLVRDVRVGWSSRRVFPTAPLGATAESAAFSLGERVAVWGGLETQVLEGRGPLSPGDTLGCLLALRRKDGRERSAQNQGEQHRDGGRLSSLRDLETLVSGFQDASLDKGKAKAPLSAEAAAIEGMEAFVQFSVNGRTLQPCVFGGSRAYMLAEEFFPAVSLIGSGASCRVNFGPRFRFPPRQKDCLLSCSKLELPVTAPRTFDLYGKLVSPHKLVIDAARHVLRPQTIADCLEASLQKREKPPPQRSRTSGRRRSWRLSGQTQMPERTPDSAEGNADERRPAEGEEEDEGFEGEGLEEMDSWRALAEKAPLWRKRFLAASKAVHFSEAEREKLKRAFESRGRRSRLLRSLHRASFESQLKTCRAVLEAAASNWKLKASFSALGFRRILKRPWDWRCLCSDSEESTSSEDSGEGEGFQDPPQETLVKSREECAAQSGDVWSESLPSKEERPASLADPSSDACAAGKKASSFVDFYNPSSLFFPFLLPTLDSLALAADGVEDGDCQSSRLSRVFWNSIAALDSQRRPLNPNRFFGNCQVDFLRRKKQNASASRTCTRKPAAKRRRGAAAEGEGGVSFNAALGLWEESVQVGGVNVKVPVALDTEDCEEEPLAAATAEGSQESSNSLRRRGGVSSRNSRLSKTDTEPAPQTVQPQPLSKTLLQRLALTPRQLLEGLKCKFRVVCAPLTGSPASPSATRGLSCLYTVVVRLRNLQATAQGAEEEAAKDLACEFWLQQHSLALCGASF